MQQANFSQSFVQSNANADSFDQNLLHSLSIKCQIFDLNVFLYLFSVELKICKKKNTALVPLAATDQLF